MYVHAVSTACASNARKTRSLALVFAKKRILAFPTLLHQGVLSISEASGSSAVVREFGMDDVLWPAGLQGRTACASKNTCATLTCNHSGAEPHGSKQEVMSFVSLLVEGLVHTCTSSHMLHEYKGVSLTLERRRSIWNLQSSLPNCDTRASMCTDGHRAITQDKCCADCYVRCACESVLDLWHQPRTRRDCKSPA
jgi:hypothetical protein